MNAPERPGGTGGARARAPEPAAPAGPSAALARASALPERRPPPPMFNGMPSTSSGAAGAAGAAAALQLDVPPAAGPSGRLLFPSSSNEYIRTGPIITDIHGAARASGSGRRAAIPCPPRQRLLTTRHMHTLPSSDFNQPQASRSGSSRSTASRMTARTWPCACAISRRRRRRPS